MSANSNSPFSNNPVVLIDDSIDIREAFQILMDMEGIPAITIESAEKGLELLREGKIKPRVIILDLTMPDIDGHQFLKIREAEGLGLDIPIIVFSAHRQTEVLPGTIGWAKKPIDVENLLNLIAKHSPTP